METVGAGTSAAGPRLVPYGLLLSALVAAALSRGGRGTWIAVAVAALLCASLSVSAAARSFSAAELRRAVWVPAVLLGGWAVLRAAASPAPTGGLGYALLLLAALAVLVLVRRSSDAEESWLVETMLLAGVLVAASGWLGVLLRTPPWGHLDGAVWRAATSMTYENAAAGLLVPLALLALGTTATSPRPDAQRRNACVAVLLLTGAGATLSRGGAVALTLGLLVLTALLRRAVVAASPPLVGAAVSVVSLLPSLPSERPANLLLATAGLAAGLAVAVSSVRTAGWVSLIGGLSVSALAAVTHERWLPSLDGRLTLESADRVEQARAAVGLWLQNPATGAGPGEAVLHWERHGVSMSAVYVHNEYLQVLVELGLVGLLLLSALCVGVVRLVREGSRSDSRRGLWAGIVAGLSAFALHSGFDFLWHVPVVVMTVAAMVAVASKREEDTP